MMFRRSTAEDKALAPAGTLLERAQAAMEAADADYQMAVRALHALEFGDTPAQRAARQTPAYPAALTAAQRAVADADEAATSAHVTFYARLGEAHRPGPDAPGPLAVAEAEAKAARLRRLAADLAELGVAVKGGLPT
jgi:hypothetical protein